MSLSSMGLVESAEAIRSGRITSVELTKDCLARIAQLEGTICAWAYLNEQVVLASAALCDEKYATGVELGPLHGVPIGIKDIIDTADMPTEYGSALYAGRLPQKDAVVVDRLRQAGAIIMGKTVTAELASCGPGKTRNPHNPDHTPGGSSSGSAAAVASCMVAGALGTQTRGSVLRPASYCGIYGFKPTYGLIPRTGVLMQSFSHDQIGTFARSIQDLALLTNLLIGPHAGDEATNPTVGRTTVSLTTMSSPLLNVKLAYVQSPLWDQAESATQRIFGELRDKLGNCADDVELPEAFGNIMEWHMIAVDSECAQAYAQEYSAGEGMLHPGLREQIERGRSIHAVDYIAALKQRKVLNALLDPIFDEYDAILTLASTGEAPLGLESTGDPVFCSAWTFCGTPALSLPLLQGESSLPLAVQLVGRCGEDARLLRTANWLVTKLSTA
jgi:Asp-tRNA(Asn)/Glu-tRNA(Gln) amidotransferase A subunit family amidase